MSPGSLAVRWVCVCVTVRDRGRDAVGGTVDRDIVAPEEAFLVYEGLNTNTGSRRFKLTTVYKSRHDTTFTLFKRCVDAYK